MLDATYYIYRHIRPDTNEVFYIGKGNMKTKSHGVRHLEKNGRNSWWKRIVAKNNGVYISEIVCYCETEEEVNIKEIELIKHYGRRDLKLGTLCNLTDGADGSTGIKVSKETRKKLSEAFSGKNHPNYGKKLSKETCEKKSKSMKASDKSLKGKKLPDWWKDKIRQTKFAENNPMYGRHTPISKKVINVITGEIYDTILLAGESVGLKGRLLHQYLSGHRINKSPFVYLTTYHEIGKDLCIGLVNKQPAIRTGNSKKVIDINRGVVYSSAIEASKKLGCNPTTLRCKLAGSKINNTTLKYA